MLMLRSPFCKTSLRRCYGSPNLVIIVENLFFIFLISHINIVENVLSPLFKYFYTQKGKKNIRLNSILSNKKN